MNHHIGVTISLDASEEVRQKAMMAANILHLPWKERKATLGETCASDCDCLLIYTKQLPEIWTKDSRKGYISGKKCCTLGNREGRSCSVF